MLILPINIFEQTKKQYQKGLYKDCLCNNFIFKNSIAKDNISFQSNTSAGNVLKKLRKVKCPYFGVEMISGNELKKVEKYIDECTCVKDIVKVLSKYRHYMQDTEKKIYIKFVEISQKSPSSLLFCGKAFRAQEFQGERTAFALEYAADALGPAILARRTASCGEIVFRHGIVCLELLHVRLNVAVFHHGDCLRQSRLDFVFEGWVAEGKT